MILLSEQHQIEMLPAGSAVTERHSVLVHGFGRIGGHGQGGEDATGHYTRHMLVHHEALQRLRPDRPRREQFEALDRKERSEIARDRME